jgi:AcrR family transcriptional regulator
MSRVKEDRYHHGDLKRALLEVSIELLEEGGLEGLNVAEAGRRLGVSSGAPYKHFPDRRSLLRAVATEGNRRLTEDLLQAVCDETDPDKAFALTGVAYVRWAAEHPSLYRLILDPTYTEYAAAEQDVSKPQLPEGLEGMATFWTDLAKRVRSPIPLTHDDPLIQQLAGRALAHGLASLFVTGVFASLDIDTSQATRLARAVIGLPPEPAAETS